MRNGGSETWKPTSTHRELITRQILQRKERLATQHLSKLTRAREIGLVLACQISRRTDGARVVEDEPTALLHKSTTDSLIATPLHTTTLLVPMVSLVHDRECWPNSGPITPPTKMILPVTPMAPGPYYGGGMTETSASYKVSKSPVFDVTTDLPEGVRPGSSRLSWESIRCQSPRIFTPKSRQPTGLGGVNHPMLNSNLGYSGAKIKHAPEPSLSNRQGSEHNTTQRTSLIALEIGFPDYVRFKPRTPPQENQNGIADNAGNADDSEED
ncbi:hypothetical protein NA56DRAFT_697204 [Hyaloscypha hepaticicola]|uniref:Uncharacterized protein n=1 Tax=Hyaloscypha hepaticicola TaxID=2082293 RepID=A0A2J6QL99_9HELO|nr:hypothetical protein NA56DRAFT_697204 [Hyaloscypha hepaticicola]